MSIRESLDRLRQLALAMPRDGCDWEDRPTFRPAASMQTIAALESLVGFTLPPDVQLFFAETDCIMGMSVHNGYWIGDTAHINASVKQSAFPTLIGTEPVLPIASDGGGNAFLLGRSGQVWRWNHETGNVTYLTDTFDKFLLRVADDWTAYIHDTPDWQFLV